MNNKLSKNICLPYQIIKGSYETRQSNAAHFTNVIVHSLVEKFDEKGVSLSKFGRNIKKVLPEKTDLFVCKNKDDAFRAQLCNIYNNKQIAQYSLNLTPDKNKKIGIIDIPTIGHEIRHLADFLYHPKTLSREQKIIQKNIRSEKFYNFYEDKIYNIEEINNEKSKKYVLEKIRKKTKTLLKRFSAEDKIDLLQDIRYNLITERNAFKQETKIAKKLSAKKKPVNKDSLVDLTQNFMFDEKIQLFHDMISELIRKERNKHKINMSLKKLID